MNLFFLCVCVGLFVFYDSPAIDSCNIKLASLTVLYYAWKISSNKKQNIQNISQHNCSVNDNKIGAAYQMC